MKIAIIGMGVAGVSLIREIKKQMSIKQLKKVDIIIFSDAKLYGTGLPYQEDDSTLLLNQYTESMTIDPTHPNDFINWVEKNRKLSEVNQIHVPRWWFGDYLKERLEEWLVDLPVRIIYQKVKSITQSTNGTYSIKTKDHTEEVAVVHLAIGHLAYQDPFKLKEKSNYLHHPYPAIERLKVEKKNALIGILGSRLTAIDALRFIKKNNPSTTFHFFSLDGNISSVRGHFPNSILTSEKKEAYLSILLNTKKELTLKQVEEWFVKIGKDYQIDSKWIWKNLGSGDISGLKKDLKYLEELGKFQKFIGEMKELFPFIWSALPDKEKTYFKETREIPFLNFKIPIPQNTAKELLGLYDEGKLIIHKPINSVSDNENGFLVECEGEPLIQLDYLINATGQRTQLSSNLDNQQPLIKQLIDDKLITPYSFGGVDIDYPSMSVIDETGHVRHRFKVYGQLASGIQYGNTNVDLVSQSAITGIQSMLQTLTI